MTQLLDRCEEDQSVIVFLSGLLRDMGPSLWTGKQETKQVVEIPVFFNKQQPFAKKIMLTFFWEVKGPILVFFKEHGQTNDQYNVLCYA